MKKKSGMRNTSSLLKNSLLSILIASLFSACEQPNQQGQQQQNKTQTLNSKSAKVLLDEGPPISVDSFDIITEQRLRLTAGYALDNYGVASAVMDSIEMIVIHYTAIPTLAQTLAYFKPDILETARKKNYQKSILNVGVHYVIDKEGRVFHLIPDSIMGRHLIGFNYHSIGIENVGKDSTELTTKQVQSNVELIHFLSKRHQSIKYLIGHSEYTDQHLAHFQTLIAKDPEYQPYPKYDPGSDFMSAIRQALLNDYNLTFQQ
jgi:hypothetical protein